MSALQRIVFGLIAVAIAVVALAVLRTDGNSNDTASNAGKTVTAAAQPTTTTPNQPKPKPVLLRSGSVKTISVDKGDTIRFRAISPVADELHVHGYDTTWQLQPGKVRTVSFKATLDGQYEIELHGSGEQVARLRVQP